MGLRRRKRKPGRVRICRVATSDATLGMLLVGQHRYFVEQGYEVSGAALPDTGLGAQAEAEGMRFQPVPMSRRFGVLQDIRGLVALYRLFRRTDFDMVEAGTLKGGFLGMVGAYLARVPVRIFTIQGLSYSVSRGPLRWAIKSLIRWSCRLSTHVITICHELRQTCGQDRLCDTDKVSVILSGSSNGVDLERFTLTDELREEGRRVRQQAGILDDAIVVGLVARLKVEKGVCELVEAFRRLESRWPKLWLLFVGPFETMQDRIPPDIETLIHAHPRIACAGFQQETPKYYAAMDVFALPSYREGFGTALIEAAAVGLPVVTSDTLGCREACADGETGILVPVRDVASLTIALERLVSSPTLRQVMGRCGRRRVEQKFDQLKLWNEMDGFFRTLLKERGLPQPDVLGPAT